MLAAVERTGRRAYGQQMSRARSITMMVVVADPDHVALDAIRACIERDPTLELVATASRRDDAADLLRHLKPDVAVIDVGLLSYTDHPLHGWGPISQDVRLVGVGPDADSWIASRLHAAGFSGYVCASRIDQDLCHVLHSGAASHA